MAKKKINVEAIANELRDGSVFFRDAVRPSQHSDSPSTPPQTPSPVVTNPQSDLPLSHQSDKVTSHFSDKSPKLLTPPPQPAHRRRDFYIRPDQDLKVERIVLARRTQGLNTDRSTVIREALDLLPE